VAKIIDDLDVLTAFYDYPAEHWIHLRTTNPLWSSRPSRPCGCGNGSPRDPAPAPPAWRSPSNSSNPPRPHWRAVNAPHLVALVRAGAKFENGALVERPDESGGDQQAA
jgi:putative transposase